MARRKPVSNLVVFSDTHCGCKLALCPEGGVSLDEGGSYKPSAVQRKVYGWWREFWDEYVPSVVGKEPYDILFNGDAMDGTHHDAVHQISNNIADQLNIAQMLFEPVVEKCRESGGRYYHIRGTEAHVGKSAQYEEMLARNLGAKKNREGQAARYDIYKRVGDGLVHALHHIGVTGSQAYEATAVHKELVESFAEAARQAERPPDIIVRSHRHRCIATDIPVRRTSSVESAIAIVTPAWQLKTPFTWKIAGARQSTPQIGGIIIRQHSSGILYIRRYVQHIKRSSTET